MNWRWRIRRLLNARVPLGIATIFLALSALVALALARSVQSPAFEAVAVLPGVAEEARAPYRSCDEARAAGNAPLLRGQPGYGAHLDRDNDGMACEPYLGR